MSLHYYKAFDLVWKVKNINIPELIKIDKPINHDIIVKQDNYLNWEDNFNGKYNTHFLQIDKNNLLIKLNKLGILKIINGNEIRFKKESSLVEDRDINTFMLGSGFGAILIQKDYLVLHGNALEKNNEAIICLGPSGAGKSTLAYSLMTKGWKLLADDQVVINNDGYVLPGLPRVKLWEDAMDEYLLNKITYQRVRKNINKFTINAPTASQASMKCKLRSVYFLNVNRAEKNDNYYGILRNQSEKNIAIKLRNNLFRPRFVKGLGKEAESFKKLINLLKTCTFADLILPFGLTKMDKSLCNLDL